jgi:hypothetical protein
MVSDTHPVECDATWLYRFRLDGQCCGLEEYFRILLQSWFSYDFLVQQETGLRSPKALQRQSTLLIVLLAEKQCGSGSYF